jgi:hypothetical protein
MPGRRGVLGAVKGFVINALGATRERVEDFSAEVQHRSLKILWLIIWSVVGAVSMWLALCLAVLTIIFGFDLDPRYAFGIPTLIFLVVGLLSFVMFKRTKQSHREESDYNDGRDDD